MKQIQRTGRATIRAIKQGVDITIPTPKSFGPMAFLGVWLTGWSIGGFVAIQAFLAGIIGGSWNWFIFAWLCGWFLGEVAVIRKMGSMLFGKECIRIIRDQLNTGHYILGIGKTHTFDLDTISNMRIVPANSVTQEKLWFTYRSKTVMCCRDVDREEAATLLQHVTDMLAFRCHTVERIVFGDLPGEDAPSATLRNPDVSNLTFPFVRLKHVIIDTETHNFGQVEHFLTYAVNDIGQPYLSKYVEVYVYGDSEKLHPNLLNNFRNLCKGVHYEKHLSHQYQHS
jgi:hypothetical protein